MSETQDIGRAGEILAVDFLTNLGYQILEKNWRFGKDEVDIIARDGDSMVFVEVKTRQSSLFGEPEESVNREKQRFLIRAADAYLTKNNIEIESRFDIVSVLMKGNQHRINHLKEAFYPTMC